MSYQDRNAVVPLLCAIYEMPSERSARAARSCPTTLPLGQRYPRIAAIWELAWERITPALASRIEVRRDLHTTNAIEWLNSDLRAS